MSRKIIVTSSSILLILLMVWSFEANNRQEELKNCNSIDCWQKILDDTLDRRGIPAAFDKLAQLYSSKPNFASACHDFTHKLGAEAYSQFSKGKDFDLNSKTSYCGYGFYHGFMEELLSETKDIQKAKDFCKYVGDKLQNQTTDGEGACYHGIGHGTTDGEDPSLWGDPFKMIKTGLDICEKVAGDDRSQYGKLYRCVSGVFNSIEILSTNPKYKIPQITQDSFYLCPSEPKDYGEACYTNMLPALLRKNSNDLMKSEADIEKIKEKSFSIRWPVTSGLFDEFIRLNLSVPDYNINQGIKMCQSLNNPYRLACIYGLGDGHMKYGKPKEAYVLGLAFCANPNLQSDERRACYNSILPKLRIWYSVDKSKAICDEVPDEFKKYCHV